MTTIVAIILLAGALQGCASAQASKDTVAGTIDWSQAASHAGEAVRVSGPVVSTHFASGSNGTPTFINLGKDYPDAGRFQAVVFGDARSAFPSPPESMYAGRNVIVSGQVQMYNGVPEIVVTSPSSIEIVQ
ncbi:MAG: DNA-binding protein [Coriobacteriia bacterium]|nr:DNA-binding protein [Coriobacteriia bacterium]